MRVGVQLAEVLETHRNMKRKAAKSRALELLRMVGIPDPKRRLDAHPHEMSGGMAQRVMIAMALACEPELLIADEPTTALDVTIQAQILDLMRRLQQETGTAIILITHDLGVVAEMCSRVAVMYSATRQLMTPLSTRPVRIRAQTYRPRIGQFAHCPWEAAQALLYPHHSGLSGEDCRSGRHATIARSKPALCADQKTREK